MLDYHYLIALESKSIKFKRYPTLVVLAESDFALGFGNLGSGHSFGFGWALGV